MWCLARLLPIIIGDKIPLADPRWSCFLTLLSVTDYLLAPVITQDAVSYLRSLIEDHHMEFIALYPHCPVTPKLHYIIHYPEWINR